MPTMKRDNQESGAPTSVLGAAAAIAGLTVVATLASDVTRKGEEYAGKALSAISALKGKPAAKDAEKMIKK